METIIKNGRVGYRKGTFLTLAKRDYRNYREALAREFYQNSIDAGSTEINVLTNEEERTIEIVDDGCGMSLDTLQNALLTFGGSFKDNENATGAFGKAKELLFFSWEEYTILTRNYLVQGASDEYTIKEIDSPTDGTWITIKIQEDEDFYWLVREFTDVAKKIETDTRIIVDGKHIPCARPKGKFLKEIPNIGNLYITEDQHSSSIDVRINGIWMHDWYVGSALDSAEARLTLELTNASIGYLTSNRDGLVHTHQYAASEFIEKLMIDRKNTLKPDKVEIVAKVPGQTGLEMDEELVSSIAWKEKEIDRIREMVSYAANNGMLKDLMMARVVNTPEELDSWDKMSYLKFTGYKADFITKCEKGELVGMKNLLTTKKAATIATIWTETIKQVLLDNGNFKPFTAGFTSDKDYGALTQIDMKSNYVLKGDDGITLEQETNNPLVFLLNPYKLLEKYNLSNRKLLMNRIKQLAIHEVTHLWEDYHHESFTMRREKVEENTWKSEVIYNKISKIKR